MTDITLVERPVEAGVRVEAVARTGHRFGKARRGLAVVVGVAVLALGSAPALAEESAAAEAGFGALAAVSSLVYAPVKIVYALGGFIVGGFAWALSAGDSQVATAVITPATRGDYVVTPANIKGEKPLEFIGRAPTPSYGATQPPAY